MSSLATPTQTQFDENHVDEFQISVLADFSDDPFGRFPSDSNPEFGDSSGESFRNRHMKPALEKYSRVHVDLNGNIYGSSWLEEAFGGLVRKGYFRANELKQKLTVSHDLESYVVAVWHYIDRAEFGIASDES